ncbi:MAG: NHLP bacteriocin system secretion protein [Planctomycetota bacterium]|jgi:HlyD family secretion protein
MSLAKKLFRESALERLSSPEQLDQLLQVTSPKGWMSLVATWALLAVVIVWSIIGRVPTREMGKGMLVAGDGMRLVLAPGAGPLESILVEVGQEVAADEIVARINTYEVLDQLNNATVRKDELTKQLEDIEKLDGDMEARENALAADEQKRVDNLLAAAQERINKLDERRATIEKALNQDAAKPFELFRAEDELRQARASSEQIEMEYQQLLATNQSKKLERDRSRRQLQVEINALAARVEALKERRRRESEIRTEFGGTVVEVRARENSAVALGDDIMLIAPTGTGAGDLQAILYVSAVTGKRIKEGMDVAISPSTVSREEYGALRGTVKHRAEVPTTRAAMMRWLNDDDLVDQFMSEHGSVLEVQVRLTRDADAASGYAWSSETGPPFQISAGTLCNGSVTVDTRSPLSFVLPMPRGEPDDE